jgi:hypothetical protein
MGHRNSPRDDRDQRSSRETDDSQILLELGVRQRRAAPQSPGLRAAEQRPVAIGSLAVEAEQARAFCVGACRPLTRHEDPLSCV